MSKIILLVFTSLFFIISCGGGGSTESTPPESLHQGDGDNQGLGDDQDQGKSQEVISTNEEWRGAWKLDIESYDIYILISEDQLSLSTYSDAYRCLSKLSGGEITALSETSLTFYNEYIDKYTILEVNFKNDDTLETKVINDNNDGSISSYTKANNIIAKSCSEDAVEGKISGVIEFNDLPDELEKGSEHSNFYISIDFDINDDGYFGDNDLSIQLNSYYPEEESHDLSNLELTQYFSGNIFSHRTFSPGSYIEKTGSTIKFVIDKAEHVVYKYLTQNTQIRIKSSYMADNGDDGYYSSYDSFPEGNNSNSNPFTIGMDTTYMFDTLGDAGGDFDFTDISTISITVE